MGSIKTTLAIAMAFLALLWCVRGASAQLASPVPCEGCWLPPLFTTWQWQLQGQVDLSVEAEMYDIDLFETTAQVVEELHKAGRKAICYMSAGTWEKWRPDKDEFPAEVIGNKYSGWKGERWLDIRRLDVIGPIMQARLDQCKAKGFDGVEFDNIDGFQHETGFPLTYDEQLAYNIFLANEAHLRGLNAGYKNNPAQVQELLPYFDWALVEQCVQYRECEFYLPFVQAGKPVMAAEYKGRPGKICPSLNAYNFNGIKKKRSLKAWRVSCR